MRLPLEDPRMWTSFNIPEFAANVPDISESQLFSGVGQDAEVRNVKLSGGEADEPESR